MATIANYLLRPPPAAVEPLGASFRWRRDLVDYSRHEAYADLVNKASLARRASALAFYSRHFLLLAAKRLFRYEMIPTEFREGRSLKDRLGFAMTVAKNMASLGRRGRRRKGPPVNEIDKGLETGGVAVLEMPAERLAQLQELAAPFFDRLRTRRGTGANRRQFDESRSATGRHVAPDLYSLIETIFAESGIAAAASRYIGRPAQLVDVNPQINDASDSFWRDIFEDLDGRPLPQTAYCHRDASGGDLKVIIYCSDVGEDNGPFGYAVGSNNMAISAVDNLLCEANDHNGLSLTNAEARAKFAALPAKLRQKGAFGNDLEDDSAQSRQIVGSLWQITGPEGSMVMFDSKGVHRGGMVTEGERRVITCVLG